MKRALAALLIACATLLAFEGAVTAFAGTSLLRRLPWLDARLARGTDPVMRGITEEQRWQAAAQRPGILSLHTDPRVGWTLRQQSDLLIRDGEITSDGDGLRKRVGAPETEDAFRVALMGGSIPFGFGVDDDETIAHQLELLLAEARGPDARQVICRTVAMPRWSTPNAAYYLRDHWDALRPDLVLWMPFSNDLSDTDVVNDTGRRSVWPDARSPDPWLLVSSDVTNRIYQAWRERLSAGETAIGFHELGPMALTADIAPESSRRYDQNVAIIISLNRFLSARDIPLVLLQYREYGHAWHLRSRLANAGSTLPVVPLLTEIPHEFTQLVDPHPSAETMRVIALLTAKALIEQGLVDAGAGRPLPAVPDAYVEYLAPERSVDDAHWLANSVRESMRENLQSEIDLRNGRGVMQVYGGLNEAGLVGPCMLAMIAPAGDRLALELEPLPDRPDLYPLDVRVEVDGVAIGSVRIEAGGSAGARLLIPPRPNPGQPLEVKLVAPDWVVVRRDRRRVLAAFRPLRIACEEG